MTNHQLWAVHSEKDGRPVFRTWAKSKTDADAAAARLQADDAAKEDRYFVQPLSDEDVFNFKRVGMIPADA
jgi:hypothetical protein